MAPGNSLLLDKAGLVFLCVVLCGISKTENLSIKKKYNCWWCGNPGNSGEHKFKRTDLIGEFGESFNDKEDYPVLNKDSKQIRIQGPNSKHAKFENVMCSNCNNVKSQKIDETYAIVINELIDNHVKYENQQLIDFEELFGNEWMIRKQDFISYYVKHFCCRLARNNVAIPKQILEYLNKEINYLEIINFSFQHKLDLKRLFREMRNMNYEDGFLEFGKLMQIRHEEKLELAYSYLTRKWVRTEMFFSYQIVTENFPGLRAYYQTPYITYELVSIFEPEQIRNYDDIINAINTHKTKIGEKDINYTTDWINDYFRENPYK